MKKSWQILGWDREMLFNLCDSMERRIASVLAAERLIERSKQVVCGVVRVSTTIRLCELEKKMMIDDELCM